MNNTCSKCGGELIPTRLAPANMLNHKIVAIAEEDAKKTNPRHSDVLCDTCSQCGSIENIRVEKPSQLQ